MLFIYPCLLLGDLWDISSSTQYYDSWVILGSLWGFSGVTLAILWGHFIDILWSHWGYNWITLGISMGSLWRYSGGNFWLRPWSEPNKSDCHFLPPSLPLADSSILSLVLTGRFLCHLFCQFICLENCLWTTHFFGWLIFWPTEFLTTDILSTDFFDN